MNKDDIIISLLKEIDENIDNVNDSEGTNANLEELTITSNGIYTPQEGVDGFSKVTANVVPTKRVVLPSFGSITNACLDENGYWAAELVDVRLVTSIQTTFFRCTLLKSADVSKWDVSNKTTLRDTFRECSSLQSLDVRNWDVGKVTDMYQTFYGCKSLQSLDVSGWDTSNVTNMGSTFCDCKSLQSLDLSGWDTSNVTNMGDIFYGCSSLQSLVLPNTLCTSKIASLGRTFMNCASLQSLDLSGWDTSNVTNMSDTFRSCTSLQLLDIRNWNVGNVTSVHNLFNGCSSLKSLIGGMVIDSVISNNIGALNGLNISTGISSTKLDRASLRAVINGLADLTGSDAQTLTLGETLIAKLTEEDIAIATAKNWTLS